MIPYIFSFASTKDPCEEQYWLSRVGTRTTNFCCWSVGTNQWHDVGCQVPHSMNGFGLCYLVINSNKRFDEFSQVILSLISIDHHQVDITLELV